MSLFERNSFPDLFLPEKDNYFLDYPTLSDNLNDIFSESSQEPIKKNIKFILTKEPAIFLKKKLSSKEIHKSNENLNGGRWTKEEQKRFAEAVLKSGNDWKLIQTHVNSRNMTQVRSHAQKFLMKLKETNFMLRQNIDLNLSWTKIMNYLRRNLQYEELKELLFSVEKSEEKIINKKMKKINKIKKVKKNKKKNNCLNSGEYSKCDTNGESFRYFFDEDEKELENIKLKEEEDENETKALEKFIECFNGTSQDFNLNSSFEDIFSKNNEEINEIPYKEKILI